MMFVPAMERADSSVESRGLKTILIAEHHRPTLAHLQASLRQAGSEVHGTADPTTAVEHFAADHPGQFVRANERGSWLPRVAIETGFQKFRARPPVLSGDLEGALLPSRVHSFLRLRRDGVWVAFRELMRRVFFLQGARGALRRGGP